MNKVTSKLSEKEKQELYKSARSSNQYSRIWQNVGKCVFCDLREKYILMEENGVVMTINLYPYIDGHLMIIPRRHINSPKELTEKEWETIRKFSYLAKKLIKKVHNHKGMWTLIREGGVNAQMSVSDHLHVQCIPFDAPDLCVWNYREIKYSAVENVGQYRQQIELIQKQSKKFHKKYQRGTMLSVACDLIILNKQNKIALQKRSVANKLKGDFLTLPGGHIENATLSLENELAREVEEETGFKPDQNKIQLLDSRISSLTYIYKDFSEDRNELESDLKFLWNTYHYVETVGEKKIKAKDDAKEIVWVSLEEIDKYNLTKELKKTLKKFYEKTGLE